jgi:HK97 family phage major capsid protein
LNITVDPSGGYMVPDQMVRTMIQKLNEYADIRRYATVLPTTSDVPIPVANQDGVAYWRGEEEARTESDETVGQVVLNGYFLTALQKVSRALTEDSVFDISAFLSNAFALRFSKAEEPGFTTGNGVGKPTGFMVDAEVGKTAADDLTIDPDEILDMYYSLKAPYRKSAIWTMNDNTMCEISKLKDGAGRYIWQQALALGDPDTIRGRPVVPNTSMADIAASAKPIAFGDFSFYWIADRGNMYLQRLVELYANTGQIGFQMERRMDGKLTISEAIKVFVMHA